MPGSLVSVIIPVYNKEKYVEQCLKSVLQQTHKEIQIIVVDDGSTDNSLSIVLKIRKLDNRIQLFPCKNAGVSAARNFGLKQAEGEFIMFVDADDYINKDLIESLLLSGDSDFNISGFVERDANHKKRRSVEANCLDSTTAIVNSVFSKELFPVFSVPYAKLFKRSLIEDNNIFFPEIDYGEDTVFIIECVKNAKKIRLVDADGYINRIVSDTISRRTVNDIENKLKIIEESAFPLVKNNDDIKNFLQFRNMKLIFSNYVGDFKLFSIYFKKISKSGVSLPSRGRRSKADILIFILIATRLRMALFLIFRIQANS